MTGNKTYNRAIALCAILALLFAALAVSSKDVAAQDVQVAQVQVCAPAQPACEAARQANDAPAYNGAIAPTIEPMSCIRLVTYGRAEILWIEADLETFTSILPFWKQNQNAGYAEPFVLDVHLTMIESCIPTRLLDGIYQLVICTGDTPGEGYSWQVSAESLQGLKGPRGQTFTYLPLLTGQDMERFDPADVAAAYQRRYW